MERHQMHRVPGFTVGDLLGDSEETGSIFEEGIVMRKSLRRSTNQWQRKLNQL